MQNTSAEQHSETAHTILYNTPPSVVCSNCWVWVLLSFQAQTPVGTTNTGDSDPNSLLKFSLKSLYPWLLRPR